jgi:hypothetical protein
MNNILNVIGIEEYVKLFIISLDIFKKKRSSAILILIPNRSVYY